MPHKKTKTVVRVQGMHPDSGGIEKKLGQIVSEVLTRSGKVRDSDAMKLLKLQEQMQRIVDKIMFRQDS